MRGLRKFTALGIPALLIGTSANGAVILTTIGSPVNENFDTLANTGINNATFPTGWTMTETGGGARDNEQYAGDNGVATTGDTYSYGTTATTERAFGGLQSGTLIPVIGAEYNNNTGSTITSLDIDYVGEEWRLGTADANIDRLDFEYSLDATSLTTGTWVPVNSLDFSTPNNVGVGAKDGNATGNFTPVSSSIIGLSIPQGNNFWIRFLDLNVTGADDGLSVDEFNITPQVPEPSMMALGGLGFAMLAARRRRSA